MRGRLRAPNGLDPQNVRSGNSTSNCRSGAPLVGLDAPNITAGAVTGVLEQDEPPVVPPLIEIPLLPTLPLKDRFSVQTIELVKLSLLS